MPRPSLFRRFVSLTLAVLVLSASVGVNVQRHTCRMSGRSKVEMSVAGPTALGGCASLQAPARPIAKDHCCDVSSHLHKLSAPAHEHVAKVVVPAPLLAVLEPNFTWAPPLLVAVPATSGARWFAADSSPPPLAGRALLAFVCTLVV